MGAPPQSPGDGQGSVSPRLEEAFALLPDLLSDLPGPVLWARQVHSARLLRVGGQSPASSPCGEGDALLTSATDVALAVVTADCVPVLLAGARGVAAVHAGWRGLAAGIIGASVLALKPTEAWIGPSIGPCCYEVGEEVAAEVERALDAGKSRAEPERESMKVRWPGRGSRPHLDLYRAAELQLLAAGVGKIQTHRICTRCHPQWLASYRRDGKGAGRNIALVWRPAFETGDPATAPLNPAPLDPLSGC